MNKLKIIKQSMAYIISAAMFASSVPVSAVEFSAGENSTLFGSGESYENQENEENFNNSLFTDEDKSVSTFNTESDEKSVQEKQSKTYIEWMLGENEITVETSQEEALPEGFVNYSYETKDEPGVNYETVNSLLSGKYEEGYDFKIMGYSLIAADMDTPLTMPEDASYKVTEFIAKDWSRDIKVFKYENNEFTEIEGVERVVESESVTNPHYTFSLSSLEGTYVLVSGMKEKKAEKQSKTYIEWMLGENEITVETSQEEALPEGFVNYSYETKDEPGTNYETVNGLLSKNMKKDMILK